MRKTATVLALILSLVAMTSSIAFAQKTMSDSAMATANATIQAIDSTNRLISLKFDDGSMDTMYAGPEVKRFSELKVGDKVSFRYHESLVLATEEDGPATLRAHLEEGQSCAEPARSQAERCPDR